MDVSRLRMIIDSSAAKTGAAEFKGATTEMAQGASVAGAAVEKMQGSVDRAGATSVVTQSKLDMLTKGTANLGAANAQATSLIEAVAKALRSQAAAGELTTEQVAQLTAAEKALAGTGAEVVASTEAVAASQKQLTDSTRAMTLTQMEAIAMNEKLAASNVVVATTAAGSGLQLGLVRRGMTSLAASATGTSAILDRVAGSFASMALGSGVVIGIIAGIAAVALIYNKVTASAREAKKAADDFSKTQEGRTGAAAGMGIANFSMAGAGGKGADIPAMTDQIDKATKAVAGLSAKLGQLHEQGKGSGDFLAGGVGHDVAQLVSDLKAGTVGLDEFQQRMRAMDPGVFFTTAGKNVAQFGGQLIAARDDLAKLTAVADQAKATHVQYTSAVGAATESQGRLTERIAEARSELDAYQHSGKLAGDRLVEQHKALHEGEQLWTDYTGTVQGAALASLTFQAALSKGVPEAKKMYDQLLQLADIQRQAGVVKADPINAVADSLKKAGDAVTQFQSSADSVGKDQSINARVMELNNSLDTLDRSLQEQVKTGKISRDQYADAAAQIDRYRGSVAAAGDTLKKAAYKQVSDDINAVYLAQKDLNDAYAAGGGSLSELQASEKANLEIRAKERTLGMALSDIDQQRIRDTYALAAALTESEGTKAMIDQATAITLETDAMKQGEDTRATYLINKKADLAVTQAMSIANDDERTKRLAAIETLRQAELAHQAVIDAQKGEKKSTDDLTKSQSQWGKTLEHDVLGAVQQFTTKGITSFRSFFQEVESLSLRMVSQLDSSLERLQTELAAATKSGATDQAKAIQGEIDNLTRYLSVAKNVGSAVAGAMAGYSIGQQTGSTAGGILGGGLSGAASGAAVGGLPGAIVGGIAGAVGGLLGAADAQKKAAEQLEAAAKALQATKVTDRQTLLNYSTPQAGIQQSLDAITTAHNKLLSDIAALEALGPNHGGITLQQGGAQGVEADALFQAALKKLDADFAGSITSQLNALRGPVGAFTNALADAKKAEDDNIASAKALGLSTDDITKLYDAEVDALKRQEAARIQAINDGIAMRLADAEGLTTQSAALKRQITERDELAQAEKDQWSDAQKAALKFAQALEDVKSATDAAAAAVQALAALQVRFLRASGDSVGADTLARTSAQAQEVADATRAGANQTYLGQLMLVHAYENAQAQVQKSTTDQVNAIQSAAAAEGKRLDSLISGAQDQLKVTQDQLQTAQQNLQETQRVVSSLTDFGKSLLFSTLSPLSPADQLVAARQQLQDTYSRAAAGDKTAAAAFPGAANQFLTIDRGINASSTPYETDFASVQQMTATLTAQYGAQQDVETQILGVLQTQTDQLAAQIAAMQAQQTAEATAAAAEISALQEQINQSKLVREAVVSGLQDASATALKNADDVVAALAAVRSTLSDPGQSLVDALTTVIQSNQDAVTAATKAEVDAINAGASEATVASLHMVNVLEEQRLAMNDNAASTLVALEGLAGISQEQISTLEAYRAAADAASQAQIDAIANGASDATQTQLTAVALLEQQRLDYNERMDKEIANTAAIFGVGSDQVAALEATQTAINDGFNSQIAAYMGGGDPTGGQPGSGGTGGTPETGTSANPSHVVLDNPLAVTVNPFSVDVNVTVDSSGTGTGRGSVTVPGFADGGAFGGGYAMVGERGPELVAMGAARVISAEDTAALFKRSGDDSLVAATNTSNRLLTALLSAERAGNAETADRLKRLEDAFHGLVQLNRFAQKDG